MKQSETKTKSVFPLWGIAQCLVIGTLIAGLLLDNTRPLTLAKADNEPKPQDLGDFIDLRRQPLQTVAGPVRQLEIDDSKITSKSFLVADGQTGQILAQKNS